MSSTETEAPVKYVAFCDVLGFSAAVSSDFDATIALYRDFQANVKGWPFAERAKVSVYSDSMIVVSDDLPPVVRAVKSLQWAALMQGWLVRGGIARGRHWEEGDSSNLFVVSDALVKAVAIEKTVKVPAVVISTEIELGIEAWMPRFEHGPIRATVLYFGGHAIVGPFNEYWFNSAVIRVQSMLESHPEHASKYEWFLSLADAVRRDELLVPQAALDRMLELGILSKTPLQVDPSQVPT
jgi:hypothetical protein